MGGKYGIGARVRDQDGDEGVIVDKRKGERLVKYNGLGPLAQEGAELWQFKSDLYVIDDGDAPAEDKPTYTPKVGDRVRATEGAPKGEVGTVRCVDGDTALVEFDAWRDGHDGLSSGAKITPGSGWWLTTEGMELLPAARATKAWRPKVGDRVVMVREVAGNFTDAPATIASVGDGKLGIAIKFDKKLDWAHTCGRRVDDGFGYWVGEDDIAPAPLTIEAGKFYRTRDGRKVGPMENCGWDDGYPWTSYSFDIGYYSDAGLVQNDSRSPHEDLVAEWVEPEPAAVAEATAAWSIEDAKPGNVVRCESWGGRFYTAGREYTVDASGKIVASDGEARRVFLGEWSLVRAARPAIPVGAKVTISGTVTGRITTGVADNYNVVLDGARPGHNSHGFPASALTIAA